VILVDTSVWIDYLNGYASLEADYLTLCIAELRPIVLAGLVLTETLQGVRDAQQAEVTRGVLTAFPLAPEFDRSDYEHAAAIYRACRAGGATPRSAIDCLIAQLCLRHGHELLTRDRDFDAIGKLFPLKLIRPAPGVQEQALAYYAPAKPLTRRSASAPRRFSRASAAHSRATRR
jgi:predicted nucleic acid-binding protein